MISKSFEINEDNINKRLDIFLTENLDGLSRGIVQKYISLEQITVNKKSSHKDYRLKLDDIIEVKIEAHENNEDEAQEINLETVFENEDFIVIDKPAGLTVHPGAGQRDQTLINGLIFKYPKLRSVERYGLVHRLDKDTSGLILIARNQRAHSMITEMIQNRTISRSYKALVHGVPISGGTIDKPIGRHPTNRLIFCVKEGGRESVTHFRVLKKFKNFSLLDISLETGRTHQIRVHLKHKGYPIAGDKAYCKISTWKDSNKNELAAINGLKRQALHAYSLAFNFDNEDFEFYSELPQDIEECISNIQE